MSGFSSQAADKLLQAIAFERPPIIGFFGDSYADFAAGTLASNSSSAYNMDGLSPFFWALAEGYWGDCFIDGRSYSNGGYNYGVGGTSSSALISTQLGQLQATPIKPDIAYVQTLQNDSISTEALAVTYAAYVTSFALGALAAGVKLVILNPQPPKTSGTGAGVTAGKEAVNRILQKFCDVTPGCVFNNWLYLAMDQSGASENTAGAGEYVAWRGTDNTATGFSGDGTHPSTLANRQIGIKPLADILKRVIRPIAPRAALGKLYDPVNFPEGNVFGRNGMFQGTGGQYNGANNAGVAGVTQTNGDRWVVSDNNGIVITPTLTTDKDGFPAQKLTFSGTATSQAFIELTHSFFFDVNSALYNLECLVDCTSGITGLQQINMVTPMTNMGTSDNTSGVALPSPFNSLLFFKSRRPVTFANSGFATKTFKVQFVFKSGVTPTGFALVSRMGLFKES